MPQGSAFADEAGQYAWLVIVFLGLGAMQLVAAWFLGRARRDRQEREAAGTSPGLRVPDDAAVSRRP